MGDNGGMAMGRRGAQRVRKDEGKSIRISKKKVRGSYLMPTERGDTEPRGDLLAWCVVCAKGRATCERNIEAGNEGRENEATNRRGTRSRGRGDEGCDDEVTRDTKMGQRGA
jgi:hypothetical protein